jgi:hypothetical protein
MLKDGIDLTKHLWLECQINMPETTAFTTIRIIFFYIPPQTLHAMSQNKEHAPLLRDNILYNLNHDSNAFD